jgi:hypothetical protein
LTLLLLWLLLCWRSGNDTDGDITAAVGAVIDDDDDDDIVVGGGVVNRIRCPGMVLFLFLFLLLLRRLDKDDDGWDIMEVRLKDCTNRIRVPLASL